ncbi:MAG TPA: hypothetical protein VER36_11720 [Flavisolibacter sp.]|nr:hypothetical protein [Flavisolibacter sp.]
MTILSPSFEEWQAFQFHLLSSYAILCVAGLITSVQTFMACKTSGLVLSSVIEL